jgi:hypothetical protein
MRLYYLVSVSNIVNSSAWQSLKLVDLLIHFPTCAFRLPFLGLFALFTLFLSLLFVKNGYRTGLIRQFIPRINSTASYDSITAAEYPAGCDQITGAFQLGILANIYTMLPIQQQTGAYRLVCPPTSGSLPGLPPETAKISTRLFTSMFPSLLMGGSLDSHASQGTTLQSNAQDHRRVFWAAKLYERRGSWVLLRQRSKQHLRAQLHIRRGYWHMVKHLFSVL